MEFIKGREYIAKKFEFLQKGGLRGLDRVLGDQAGSHFGQTNGINTTNSVDSGQLNQPNDTVNPVNIGDSVDKVDVVEGSGKKSENEVKESKGNLGEKGLGKELKENFDDDFLWSHQYTYDSFIDSLSVQREERGFSAEERRHWSYPRRWSVRLFNLKIVNLMPESLSCFAEFDFGGSRDECRVQMGSSTLILSRGGSKNYIRTPVLKDIEKDQSRSFPCSHSFEYRGSYLDLENERLRIKVWSCKKYTVNSLVSIYDQTLLKFAEGDERVEIPMFRYVDNQKKVTCKLAFNLFFQELYDFEISLVNFRLNHAISSYHLFNYARLHLSDQTDPPKSPSHQLTNNMNLFDRARYSLFNIKMERKMKKINKERRLSSTPLSPISPISPSPSQSPSNIMSQNNVEEQDKNGIIEHDNLDQDDEEEEEVKKKGKLGRLRRKKKREKEGVGIGYVTEGECEEGDRETTLKFESANGEYIAILRENIRLFVRVGAFEAFECAIPPWPRLSVRLRAGGLYRKGLGLLSSAVRNTSSCEWENLGEICFRGTLSELSGASLEVRLFDWSAPRGANCIGCASVPMEAVVDYPFISCRLLAPEWLRLKSQREGWGERLEELQLGSVTGKLVVGRKPRYRQLRGTSQAFSASQVLVVSVGGIDQLPVNTQEAVDSFVEVSFNNAVARTNLCKNSLGPEFNEELCVPLPQVSSFSELLALGPVKLSVWGFVMDKLHFFGGCQVSVAEICFSKNTLRPTSKKTHGDGSRLEAAYDTIVYSCSKRLYHYELDELEAGSNITLSLWFFPLPPLNTIHSVNTGSNSVHHIGHIGNSGNSGNNSVKNTANPVNIGHTVNHTGHSGNSVKQGNSVDTGNSVNSGSNKVGGVSIEDVGKFVEIWKSVCSASESDGFSDFYSLVDQFGNRRFPSNFVCPLSPPPGVDSLNHIFHYVSCLAFLNKALSKAFTIDFMLRLKAGSVLDHCILLLSFLTFFLPHEHAYVAIGQQKDKKFNAFVLHLKHNHTTHINTTQQNQPGSNTVNPNQLNNSVNLGHTVNLVDSGDKVQSSDMGNLVESSVKEEEIMIYDFISKQITSVKWRSEYSAEQVRKEMRRVNFVSVNVLFNNRNLWLNVQDKKGILTSRYDINNINNWYPFIPYNPTKSISLNYYERIIARFNEYANSGETLTSASQPELVYFIDWFRVSGYTLRLLEDRLLEELKRYISMHRSAQNLATNFNSSESLQGFFKRYITLKHEERVCNEDNLLLIRSQVGEWKRSLERHIPRSYSIVIHTMHFNSPDSGAIFDVVKHRVRFIDSRENTSVFVASLKIFQMPSSLFSTYFLLMHTCKVNEKARRHRLSKHWGVKDIYDKNESTEPDHVDNSVNSVDSGQLNQPNSNTSHSEVLGEPSQLGNLGDKVDLVDSVKLGNAEDDSDGQESIIQHSSTLELNYSDETINTLDTSNSVDSVNSIDRVRTRLSSVESVNRMTSSGIIRSILTKSNSFNSTAGENINLYSSGSNSIHESDSARNKSLYSSSITDKTSPPESSVDGTQDSNHENVFNIFHNTISSHLTLQSNVTSSNGINTTNSVDSGQLNQPNDTVNPVNIGDSVDMVNTIQPSTNSVNPGDSVENSFTGYAEESSSFSGYFTRQSSCTPTEDSSSFSDSKQVDQISSSSNFTRYKSSSSNKSSLSNQSGLCDESGSWEKWSSVEELSSCNSDKSESKLEKRSESVSSSCSTISSGTTIARDVAKSFKIIKNQRAVKQVTKESEWSSISGFSSSDTAEECVEFLAGSLENGKLSQSQKSMALESSWGESEGSWSSSFGSSGNSASFAENEHDTGKNTSRGYRKVHVYKSFLS